MKPDNLSNPEIKTLAEKKIIGLKQLMSFSDDRTPELWGKFMPRRNEVEHRANEKYISMQVFNSTGVDGTPDWTAQYEKWAGVEVHQFENIPMGMETITIPTGLYAVFNFVGTASEAQRIFGYIFGEWLPASGYKIDQRPHFEELGELYKRNDPMSEEEIWIPIR